MGVGAAETLRTHPDSKGFPASVSLLPTPRQLASPLGWCGEGASQGGDRQLTLGH